MELDPASLPSVRLEDCSKASLVEESRGLPTALATPARLHILRVHI